MKMNYSELKKYPNGDKIFDWVVFVSKNAAEDNVEERAATCSEIKTWFKRYEKVALFALNMCENPNKKRYLGYLCSELYEIVGDLQERLNRGESAYYVNKEFVKRLYKNSDIKNLSESEVLHEFLLETIRGYVDDKYDYCEWFFLYKNLESLVFHVLEIAGK